MATGRSSPGGGDGTLRDIAEALAAHAHKASLVLLPLGTANDFSRAAGIPLEPAEALELLDVPPRDIDLGAVGGQIFLNMATGGFGSQVTANTSEDLKKVLGGAAYLFTGLSRFSELHAPTASCRGRTFTGVASCWRWGSATAVRRVADMTCVRRHWSMMACWTSASCRHRRSWWVH